MKGRISSLRRHWAGDLLLTAATAVALALGIQALLVKPFRVPSASMLPTLAIGERILVDRVGNRLHDPGVGDVVVFHPPAGAESSPVRCGARAQGGSSSTPCSKAWGSAEAIHYVKRVVGLPGDRIAIVGGHVIRNGERLAEPYLQIPCTGSGCDFPHEITVPDGHYYVLGDNRGGSSDSRFWGPIERDWIVGGAFASYWPPRQVGRVG